MSINKSEMFEGNLENTQDNLSKIAKDLGKETKRFVKNKEEEFKDINNDKIKNNSTFKEKDNIKLFIQKPIKKLELNEVKSKLSLDSGVNKSDNDSKTNTNINRIRKIDQIKFKK